MSKYLQETPVLEFFNKVIGWRYVTLLKADFDRSIFF